MKAVVESIRCHLVWDFLPGELRFENFQTGVVRRRDADQKIG